MLLPYYTDEKPATALSVAFGNTTIDGVSYGDDTVSEQAVRRARDIVETGGALSITEAVVDRHGGLAVYGDAPAKPASGPEQVRGWHFASAVCGFEGTGTHATAEILELFGFGKRRNLQIVLAHGGGDAYFKFRKGVGLVKTGR